MIFYCSKSGPQSFIIGIISIFVKKNKRLKENTDVF